MPSLVTQGTLALLINHIVSHGIPMRLTNHRSISYVTRPSTILEAPIGMNNHTSIVSQSMDIRCTTFLMLIKNLSKNDKILKSDKMSISNIFSIVKLI